MAEILERGGNAGSARSARAGRFVANPGGARVDGENLMISNDECDMFGDIEFGVPGDFADGLLLFRNETAATPQRWCGS